MDLTLTPDMISDWKNGPTDTVLERIPVLGLSSRSVPLASFVEFNSKTYFEDLIAKHADITSSSTYLYLSSINRLIQNIETHIAFVYPLRSVTRGLEEHMKNNRINMKDSRVKSIAKSTLNDLLEKCNRTMTDCRASTSVLSSLFCDAKMWSEGLYCNELLEAICLLIYRLQSLSKLCLTRTLLANDISVLTRLSGENRRDAADIRLWITSANQIQKDLYNGMKDIPYPNVMELIKIFSVFFKEVQPIEYGDQETSHIITALFFLDFFDFRKSSEVEEKKSDRRPKYIMNTFNPDLFEYIKKKRDLHPALMLVYEFGFDFDEFCTISQQLRSLPAKPVFTYDLMKLNNDVQTTYDNLSSVLAQLQTDSEIPELPEKLSKLIPDSIRFLGSSLQTIRELILAKYNSSKNIELNDDSLPKSQYEVAMVLGITDEEREYIMKILATVRSARELLISHLPRLTRVLNKFVQDVVLDFVRNKIGYALSRNIKPKAKSDFVPEFEKLRTITGLFTSDNDMIPPTVKPTKTTNPTPSSCLVHPGLLTLLRAQIQLTRNSENALSSTSFTNKVIESEDLREFSSFLEHSRDYGFLLTLEDRINCATDQSSFFFKELFLDMYTSFLGGRAKGIVYFPVSVSFPYTLIDHAINHSSKGELIANLYYPLSIYDDAAATALKVLKSRFLFDEIRIESEICISTISKIITDYVFDMARLIKVHHFQLQFEQQVDSAFNEDSMSTRITTVLQQNQLFLLGNHVDLKALVADQLNILFSQNIDSSFLCIDHFGVLGTILFSRAIELLKDCYDDFVKLGITLTPFKDLTSHALKTDSPGVISSLITNSCSNYMCDVMTTKFNLQTNPYRLIPEREIGDKVSNFLAQYRKTFPAVLKQTTAFVTVEHFREMLWMCGDGGLYIIVAELKNTIKELFDNFLTAYKTVSPVLRRISDAGSGSGCHKAFERFEGAYLSFVNQEQTNNLFLAMKALGNALAMCLMMDSAYQMKRQTSHQIMSYIMSSTDGNGTKNDELFSVFDPQFKSIGKYVEMEEVAPKAREITPPFIQLAISEIISSYQKTSIFNETSKNILDMSSMTGFAAVWSVLEFVFCLKEVHCRGDNENQVMNVESAFSKYGDGVMMSAAVMMCITRQKPLAHVLSIGNKIMRLKKTDLAAIEDSQFNKFLTVHQLVNLTVDFAISELEPSVDFFFTKQ